MVSTNPSVRKRLRDLVYYHLMPDAGLYEHEIASMMDIDSQEVGVALQELLNEGKAYAGEGELWFLETPVN